MLRFREIDKFFIKFKTVSNNIEVVDYNCQKDENGFKVKSQMTYSNRNFFELQFQ